MGGSLFRHMRIMVTLAFITPTAAIFNGEIANKRARFIKAYVHFRSAQSDRYVCGGVLITWCHVLTADHCKVNPNKHIAYLGGSLRHNRDSALLVLEISKVDAYGKSLEASERRKVDIALITLKIDKESMMEAGLRPVIPDWDGLVDKAAPLLTLGFGAVKGMRSGPPMARRLRVLEVHKIPTSTCKRRYIYSGESRYSMCAAASEDATICGGDSGSPLLAKMDSNGRRNYVLVGVIIATTATKLGKDEKWECEPGSIIITMRLKPFEKWVTKKVGKWRRW